MNISLSDNGSNFGLSEGPALAAKLTALAHPTRIEILRHLSAHRSCCCGQVVERLDLAQSTVSQHLKILVAAGLVRFEADGQRSRYAVDREALSAVSSAVATFTESCCSGC
ncbi:ArsR family transcriptional regulator [Mesorhizobium sp. Root157]|uniref:ArsR/SmtB family transcription factor n=1 Tax=Mesorhizobium sp. Root157 TaxID=1736477 RepID=UPI0006F54EE0|nr:metalloregulator ArsR/SmtB family transcription factor [Mesorhizobium sp. Root157]KQZ94267.1 ArsR family transcriptional regulator [Mesorhizobium sp. Root157]